MNSEIATEARSSLYFGQYKYAIHWHQTEVNCIRGLDRDIMMTTMKYRMNFEARRYVDWQNRSSKSYESKFTRQVRSDLESMRALLAAETVPMKLMCFVNEATVYTNDVSLFDRIRICSWTERVQIKQADLVLPPDAIVLKDPKFLYRTYLRNRELEPDQKVTLGQWLYSQGQEVAASLSFRELFKSTRNLHRPWHQNHVFSHYFLDHNSLLYETMLNMVVPGIVRKTVNIVKKP